MIQHSEIPFEKLAQAFDLLPAAAAFMGQDGSLHRLNAAALLLLEADQRASLSALIENSSHADDLLARLSSTGTVSDVKRLRTKIGQRDIRLTLRKLGIAADNVAFAMVLLDDITERRALERTISTSAPRGRKRYLRQATACPRRGGCVSSSWQNAQRIDNRACACFQGGAGKAPAQTGGHSVPGHQCDRQTFQCRFDRQGRPGAVRQFESAGVVRICVR